MIYKKFESEKIIVCRLSPWEYLKESIMEIVKKENIQSGIVLTCVWSLSKLNIRLADERFDLEKDAKFEIVSLVGTLI